MSSQAEFDWARMRREEDDYFAARSDPPPTMEAALKSVAMRAAREGQLESSAQALIDDLCALPYEVYLQTVHWQEVRERCLDRDDHRCRRCASRRNLNVHHLTYERRGQERAIDVITLCRACHELAHGNVPGTFPAK